MSHWKKIVLSPYFAATTGATALALTLGVANAQNAPVPVLPSIETPTPSVPASLATPNVEALRAQARALEAQLAVLPTTAAEQEAQQKIVAELSALQRQIQQAEATLGDFASYKRARAAQEGNAPFAASPNVANAPNASELLGPGLGLGTPAISPTAALPLAPREAETLRAQKEELTRQYRQLLQTMRALSPNDAALATTLQAEQTTLLNQLKEIDERLASAPVAVPTTPAVPNALPDIGLDPTAAIPPENRLAPTASLDLIGGGDVAAKIQKANEAAALLREAGLVHLASLASAEVPRLADPNFTETRFVPGTWTEGAGLAEERYNPFQQISKDEIDAIKTSIDDLKTRVDSLTEIMSNVETQLKLLTRQTVDAAPPVVAPVVPTPEASAVAPETPLAE